MVVITRVIDDYVLAYPVTTLAAVSGPPAVMVVDTPAGEPMVVLPVAETGLGTHVLGRRLGALLAPEAITALRRHAEDGTPCPLPVAPGEHDPEMFRNLLATMQALCLHEEISTSSEFPATIVRACCPGKPSCGNTLLRFEAYHDRATGAPRFRYHRDNGDTYYGADSTDRDRLREFLSGHTYAPWDHDETTPANSGDGAHLGPLARTER